MYASKAIAIGIYAVSQAWPRVRDRGVRMRQQGGPRSADFDDFLARKIEKLPVAGGAPTGPKARVRNPRDE